MHDQERNGTNDWFHSTRREPIMDPTEFAQYCIKAMLDRFSDEAPPEEAPLSA